MRAVLRDDASCAGRQWPVAGQERMTFMGVIVWPERIARRCCTSFINTSASEARPVTRPTVSVAICSQGAQAVGSTDMTVAIERPEPMPPAAAACPVLNLSTA